MAANLLHITYKAPIQGVLLYSTVENCGCSACKAWVDNETLPFADDSQMRYGLIPFQSPSESREMKICPNHIISMSLIKSQSSNSSSQSVPYPTTADITPQSAKDLNLLVQGSLIDSQWTDGMTVGGQKCEIQIKLSSNETKPVNLIQRSTDYVMTSPAKIIVQKTVNTSSKNGSKNGSKKEKKLIDIKGTRALRNADNAYMSASAGSAIVQIISSLFGK